MQPTAVLLALLAFAPMSFAQDAPKEDAPKADAPKADAPKADAPKADAPKADAPKAEEKKPEEKPADKPADKPAELPTKLKVIHLDNPSGVAVHPGTGHVFATSRQGIFRYTPTTNKIYLEVSEFPTDEYGKGPKYNIGPLGCTLWGTDRLIVPDGSQKDGDELVRIYKITDELPAKPRKATETEFALGPIKGNPETNYKGEGNYYAAVVWNDTIYVTANGDDTKGWIVTSKITDGKPGDLTGTIATKELTQVDAPVAITVTPDGANLVVGQMGEVNVPGDSLLTLYDKEGKLFKNYKTGLNDITGLAYSPKTGKLYATDFAWAEEIKTHGGLFELVIEGDEVKSKKIVSLDRPTALAFDKEGGLYITVFGTGKETGEKPNGGLIRLEPGL
jgi:DNA-binding beta-propeller fold protein YncE